MRAFVSVDLPATEPPEATAPTPSTPAHFTLVFLGEMDPARSPAYAEALGAMVRPISRFRLSLGGFGAFPSTERPRVVFRRVESGAEALERLAAVARATARSTGLSFDDRPFVPHLTTLRVRRPRDAAHARELLAGPSPVGPPPFEVEEVLLKESVLAPGGAVHRVVARLPLDGVGGPA